MRQAGKHLRGAGDDLLRRATLQGLFQFVPLPCLERLHGEQAVDEQAVAAGGWYASGRGVRTGDEAGLLEIGHDIADRRRRQVEAGKFRKCPRTDRLTILDVMFNQGFEQGTGAIIEHG